MRRKRSGDGCGCGCECVALGDRALLLDLTSDRPRGGSTQKDETRREASRGRATRTRSRSLVLIRVPRRDRDSVRRMASAGRRQRQEGLRQTAHLLRIVRGQHAVRGELAHHVLEPFGGVYSSRIQMYIIVQHMSATQIHGTRIGRGGTQLAYSWSCWNSAGESFCQL